MRSKAAEEIQGLMDLRGLGGGVGTVGLGYTGPGRRGPGLGGGFGYGQWSGSAEETRIDSCRPRL